MHASKDQQERLVQIKTRRDFVTIQSKGRKWVSKGLVLQTAENTQNQMRVGYTVTKRVDKRAVVRNRIKRRLRAVAADVLPVDALDHRDYILVGRAETASRSYETLCDDLRWCLRKMDLDAKHD